MSDTEEGEDGKCTENRRSMWWNAEVNRPDRSIVDLENVLNGAGERVLSVD